MKDIGESLGRFANFGGRAFGRREEVREEKAPEGREKAESVGSERSRAGSTRGLEGVEVCERWMKGEARDLRLGEVEELLAEYRRLVGEVRRRGGG